MVFSGRIQKFGDKDAIVERDVNGSKVRDFTIKTSPKQTLVRLSVWENTHGDLEIPEGAFVLGEGKYTLSTGQNGQEYHNISVTDIAIIPAAPKVPREVVNRQSSSTADDGGDLF
jgi:hypothetical protein